MDHNNLTGIIDQLTTLKNTLVNSSDQFQSLCNLQRWVAHERLNQAGKCQHRDYVEALRQVAFSLQTLKKYL
jgi:hypothetical protein